MGISFNTINAAALASINAVLNCWVPGGKQQGLEYLPTNPTRSDSKPGSFSINLNTSAWADFATGDKGGDLVALVAYIDGVKQSEAAERLADFLGLNLEKSNSAVLGTFSNAASWQAGKLANWRTGELASPRHATGIPTCCLRCPPPLPCLLEIISMESCDHEIR